MTGTRRNFLKGLGCVAVASSLSGCSSEAVDYIVQYAENGDEIVEPAETAELGESIRYEELEVTADILTTGSITVVKSNMEELNGQGTDLVTPSDGAVLAIPSVGFENVGDVSTSVPRYGIATGSDLTYTFNVLYEGEEAYRISGSSNKLGYDNQISGEGLSIEQLNEDLFPNQIVEGYLLNIYEIPENFDKSELSVIIKMGSVSSDRTNIKWQGEE